MPGFAAAPYLALSRPVAWVAAVLVGGYLVLARADVSGGFRRRRTAVRAG